MWKDFAASPFCKVTQNTRIFQAAVKQKEPLLLANFRTHIKQAQVISETRREDLLAMDACSLRAMECKLVCTVANFRGHKVTDWRHQTQPEWQGLGSYEACWRLRNKDGKEARLLSYCSRPGRYWREYNDPQLMPSPILLLCLRSWNSCPPCPTIAKSHRTFLATLLFLPCNARVYLVTRPSGFARCAGRPKQFVGSLRGVEGGKNTHLSSCLPPGEVALFGWLLAGAEAKHQSPCAWGCRIVAPSPSGFCGCHSHGRQPHASQEASLSEDHEEVRDRFH